MSEVTSFLYPLNDEALCLNVPRSLDLGEKVTGFVLIVAGTEGTRIVFVILVLLELSYLIYQNFDF